MAGNSSGDLFDIIVAILFIIYFVFGGLFKKAKERPKTKKKKPYKQLFPPIVEDKGFPGRKAHAPERKAAPETLTDVFAEVLEHLGEVKEEKKVQPERKPWDTYEPYRDIYEEEEPKIWLGQPAVTKKAPVKPAKDERFSSYDEEELLEKWREKKEAKRRGKKAEKAAYAASLKKRRKVSYQPLFSRDGVRNAIVMSEILEKPLALRKKHLHFGR